MSSTLHTSTFQHSSISSLILKHPGMYFLHYTFQSSEIKLKRFQTMLGSKHNLIEIFNGYNKLMCQTRNVLHNKDYSQAFHLTRVEGFWILGFSKDSTLIPRSLAARPNFLKNGVYFSLAKSAQLQQKWPSRFGC